jgi:hypothetical protein
MRAYHAAAHRPHRPAVIAAIQRVRSARRARGRAPRVRFLPPADVLGVYIYLPAGATR